MPHNACLKRPRQALFEAPAPRQRAVAECSDHPRMLVPSADPAPDRPWDRLNLPEDIRLALFAAPAPRQRWVTACLPQPANPSECWERYCAPVFGVRPGISYLPFWDLFVGDSDSD
jgi:hypothetical protein